MSPTPSSGPPLRPALALWMRILLAVVVGSVIVGAVATIATGAWVGRKLGEMKREQVQQALDMQIGPVRSALLRGNPAEVHEYAVRAKEIADLRVTVVLPSGEVIAESERPLPIPNHLQRPEICDALETGSGTAERRSTTVDQRMVYVARRLDGPDGEPLGVLRVSMPLELIEASQTEIVLAVLLAVLLAIPVAGAVAWLSARRIARPMEEMTRAATSMAELDFGHLPTPQYDDEAGRLAGALRTMGQSLANMLAQSEAKRSELDAILASMTEGVLAVDERSCVLVANAALDECLHLSRRPEAGTPLAEVSRAPELTDIVRRALAGENVPAAADVVLPGHAGRTLSVAAGPMLDADGNVSGAVIVMRDVTVMRRLEKMRLDFVANVSHELRTPLAATLSALETVGMLGPEDEEMSHRLMATARRHGQRMNEIVDDLLTLSKIEAEGDVIQRAPITVMSTLRPAASAVASLAKELDVEIRLPGPEAAELRVLGNPSRLEQVWTNLLTNAVKYNRPGGRIVVTATCDESRGHVRVSVQDTGPGIAASHLPRLFERFYRVDKARSRDRGGTGLGLAIVKHIVRSHRGRVEVRSEVGVGTTFEVWLPTA